MPRVGVIPSVSPTVPTADAVSNRQSRSGRCSMELMAIPPIKKKMIYKATMVAAFLMA